MRHSMCRVKRLFLRIYKQWHWLIAAAMFLQMGIFIGIANNRCLFVIPVSTSLGISRSMYSLSGSFSNLCSFLIIMFSGVFVKKYGYRKMAFIGLPLAAAGYLLVAVCQGYSGLLAGSLLTGIAYGLCSTTSVNRVINDWFHRYRGTVLGAVSAASGIGGSICCTALSAAMNRNSWRSAYLLCAALMGVLFLVNFLIVRDNPAVIGLRPFGDGEITTKRKGRASVREDAYSGRDFSELLHLPVFWVAIFVLIVTYVSIYLPNTVIVAHLQDRGFAEAEAVKIQSILMLILTAAKIVCGLLIDLIGVRAVSLFCLACGAVTMLLLPKVGTFGGALCAVTFYAFALPLTTITVPILTMDLFGYKSYTAAVGVFSSMISVGGMLAAPLSNSIFDHFNSYTLAFRAGTIAILTIIPLYLLIFGLADREKSIGQTVRSSSAPELR